MKHFVVTSLLLFFASVTFSQNIFTGQVVDDHHEPLAGAVIRIADSQVGVVTDIDGAFLLKSEKTQLNVEVSYVGYHTQKETLVFERQNIISLSNEGAVLSHPIGGQLYSIQPVFVSSKYPVTENTVTAGEREATNLGQDLPILLEQLPSVVATSDAGAGVGYSGIRVRGSDATRVNVTINGIPLNDSESQGVFWVNMPDFASSTGNVTLVRGVGTSTNGAGAFGASLHLATESVPTEAYVEYNGGIGSFNTWKNNIKFASGNKNGWSANGRISKITSDGYIDRASSDLQSYFLQAQHNHNGGKVKFVTFKGHEKTYQAWYGVTKDQMQEFGRTYNPYTYENQVDNYQQEHYQLLADQWINDKLQANIGLHYTVGKGYFEEFKEGEDLADYGIAALGSEPSDLVRRRWLDNDFYGAIASLDYYEGDHYLKVGGGYNKYLGDHFGEVIQGELVPTESIGENYYFNDATKNDGNIYVKYVYNFNAGTGTLSPFVDLQYRRVNYDFEGLALDGSGNVQSLPQSVSHDFFNPKLGVSYDVDNYSAYFSFARAQKEPNRNDYTESPANKLPQVEKMNDYELGFAIDELRATMGWHASVNGYFMDYTDQLAVTGGVNDVGEYTRTNVADSYRAGIELQGEYRFMPNTALDDFSIGANATFSQNKIKEFTENIDSYDAPYEPVQVMLSDTDLTLSPNIIAGGFIGYETPNELFSAKLMSKYVSKQYLDNTSNDSRSIDAYSTTNLSLMLDLGDRIAKLKDVEVNVLVNNVFDQKFESNGYAFGYIYGGEAIYESYYYPQAGVNFLSGLKVRF